MPGMVDQLFGLAGRRADKRDYQRLSFESSKTVTVCIAAIAAKGSANVMLADRRVSMVRNRLQLADRVLLRTAQARGL